MITFETRAALEAWCALLPPRNEGPNDQHEFTWLGRLDQYDLWWWHSEPGNVRRLFIRDIAGWKAVPPAVLAVARDRACLLELPDARA